MDENLEKKITTTKKRGGAIKGFIAGAVLGTLIGTGIGLREEFKNDRVYDHVIQQNIKKAALVGYAWKEGADPFFYTYEKPVLVKDTASMTMQGYMIKITPQNDTINAGPIRQGGIIGEPVYEEVKKEVGKQVSGAKKFFESLKEEFVDTYHKADSFIQEKFSKDKEERIDSTYVK